MNMALRNWGSTIKIATFIISIGVIAVYFLYTSLSINLSLEQVSILTSKGTAIVSMLRMKEFPCKKFPLEDVEIFFQYGRNPNIRCKNLKEVGARGNKLDGSKFVCFEERFNFKIQNCVVLSFGIDGNFDFEIDMGKYGCAVHGFDPTVQIKDALKNFGFNFYNIGVNDIPGNIVIGSKKYKVDRYENIINMLNLSNTVIDYLKMDIEGTEIKFLEDVLNNSRHLLKNVNQIGMEIHPGGYSDQLKKEMLESSTFGIYWNLIQRLECEGFRLAHFEKNRVSTNHYKFKNRTESGCYEVLWIRK